MPKFQYKNGVTSVILRVLLMDSASTTGGRKTGLTSASSGLIIGTIADNESATTVYTSAGSTVDTITTLGTFAAPSASHCRFKEVDATNHPGLYEIQIADARWAVASARSIIVTVQCTGAVAIDAEVQLPAFDVNDGVRGALTALPNATAGANTGLPVVGTQVPNANAGATGGLPTVDASNAVKLQSGTGANQISLAAGLVTVGTNNDKTGYTASTVSDKTGYSLAAAESLILQNGTAQAGAASTITLAAGASATDSLYKGATVRLTGGTGAGQVRGISGYVGSTKVATVDRAWATNPDNTSVYVVQGIASPALDSNLAVAAGTVSDKSGYSLTQAFPANFSSLSITGGGAVTVGTNSDKTGYSLTQAFPANFASLVIDGSGRVDISKWLGAAVNALVSGKLDALNSTRTGTAQAGAAGSITLDASASATNSLYNDQVIFVLSGTGAGQARIISGYTGSSKVATVAPNWQTNPDATSVFVVMPAGQVDLALWEGAAPNALIGGRVDANASGVAVPVSGNVTVGAYAAGQDPATLLLVTPANKLATNGSGFVTVVTNNDKTGYTASTVSDKTGYSLAQSFPANFASLSITGAGLVSLNFAQALDTSQTGDTVGGALTGARAESFGKWVIAGTPGQPASTLKMYAADGTTLLRTFDLSTSGSRV